jgi:hypothetical protein
VVLFGVDCLKPAACQAVGYSFTVDSTEGVLAPLSNVPPAHVHGSGMTTATEVGSGTGPF